MELIKDKKFYKSVIAIGVPIAFQQLVSFSVSMADAVMLGWASEADELISAASLANQLFFIFILTMVGLTGGGITLAAQYWGKGDVKAIRKITAMILHIGVIISFVTGMAVLMFPAGVMGLFTKNAVIIEKGVEYLGIVGYSYFMCGISFTLMAMLRSVEIVKISLFTDLIALFISVFLNWALIFGNLGFPALGIKGAAIATLIARAAGFAIFAAYVFLADKRLKFRFKDIFCFDKPLFGDLLKYGFPVLFNELVWALAIAVQAAIIGHIEYAKGDPVAANTVSNQIFQLFSSAIIGISNAAMVLVGKSVGEGKLGEAQRKAEKFFKMSVIMGAVGCVFVLLIRDAAARAFGLSAETLALAKELMFVMAFVIIFSSIATMTIVGTLRGGGDTRFCLIMEIAVIWGVALPLAAVFAFALKLPVAAVLAGMKSDEAIKTVICAVRIKRRKWIKEVTRRRTP
ncbi:MAG: MATE family efflux transporter [Oscillospiraceae bacterium]|jgi:putative MATE family efflux protein|nr:MATE family efflux transporter [Oscillospiraceae bacterium]